MNQGTILGSQIGRWIIIAALVVVLGALLLTIRPVFAQVTPPAAPMDLTATAVGTQKVELSWTAPAGTIVGYRIERSTNSGTMWVVASANTGNKNAYYSDNHSSLAGKSVRYRVAASNSAGMGVYATQTADVTLPRAGVQPGAPTGLKATVSATTAGTVSLSWDAPSSQGSGEITGYNVQWSANGEHTWADITGQPSGTGTTATDTGVAAGTMRYYRVAAENDQTDPTPDMGPYSASVNVTTRPAGVPVASTDLTATAVGTQKVELSWTAPAGTIVGYKIDRSTDGGTTWVVASANTGNKNAYYSDNHSSLAGKSVRYRVAASNSVGMGVYVVQTADVTLPKAGTQPGAPTGLMVTGTDGTTVTLNWNAPSGTVTGYNVQWSANGEHTWADITGQPSGTATTATDTIAAGTTRYYRVAAENTGVTPNSGPYSAVSRGTTAGVPVASTDLTATAVGTQKVELSWTAPAGTIVGYKIDRSTDGGTTWVVASANTGNKNTYYSDNHSSLAGKSVRYRVAASNSFGMGGYATQTADVTLPRAGVQPGAPTGLKATVSATTAGTVSLSWSAPSQGSGAITGYNVQWSANGEHTWADITGQPSGTGTTATDTGVAAGTMRYYRVAAENDQTDPTPGMGPYSASVNVTTRPAGVPVASTDLTATAVGTQKVELSWTAPAGTIVGYKIDRSTDGGTTWVVASANTGNKNAYYSDNHSSLAGKSVRYRVAASNSVGMGVYVVQTADVTLPKAGTQPGAPTGLTVTATNFTTVTLNWNAPSGTVTGYNVQWSANGEHTWADITGQPSGTATTATDTIAAGTTRYYRVAAENTGVTPNSGPYSTPETLGPADQPGTVSLSTQEPLVGMAITAMLVDDDDMISGQMWQWQKSMTMDGTFMDIDGATMASYTPMTADVGYYLRAKVTYNDKNRSDRMAYSDATTGTVMLPSDQMGTVTLSTQEPLVDMAITATLRDSDGMESGHEWQWKKSMDKASWMDITGAMASSYTPTAMDVGYYLQATVSYTDKYRSDRMAYSMPTGSMVVANNAPEFAADMATREVQENSAAGTAVGDPVAATDADSGDTLTYTLSGDDEMYFTIDSGTGQIMVGMDTMLDYEAETTYMVTVTATDDSDAPNSSASIAVTIGVTNVNEAPMFATDMATLTVAENTEADMAIGDPVPEATDPDAGDTLAYSLGGTDAASFGFDASTRQIKTKAALDYEDQNSYSVMVIATDSAGLTDTIDVTIKVTDVEEGPVERYDINGTAGIQIDELLVAIDDYFDGGIGLPDLSEVIDAFFNG